MNVYLATLSALIPYLLGSLSFARLVTRWWTRGEDLSQLEVPVDGTEERYKAASIGANTASARLGARGGMAVSLLDILKVFLPTLFFRLAFPEQPAYALIAAAAGLAGHVWPLYHRFHGGSGFSAIMGGLLAIDPLAVLVTPLAGWLLGMLVTRNLVVAVLSWVWLLVPWFWWRTGGAPAYLWFAVALNLLFVLAMLPEMQLALKYRKQGKLVEYGMGYLKSNPMGRGMLKIADFFHVEIK